MGSHPTLAQHQVAAEALEVDPDDRIYDHHHHHHRPAERTSEQAFDQLNPTFGVPADTHSPYGHQGMRDRETALALGTRVAVAVSRETDPNPVMWLAGQAYRAADATRTARRELVWSRRGPERVGPER